MLCGKKHFLLTFLSLVGDGQVSSMCFQMRSTKKVPQLSQHALVIRTHTKGKQLIAHLMVSQFSSEVHKKINSTE